MTLFSVVIAAFVLVWNFVDPPQVQVEYALSEQTTKFDETVVIASSYCSSDLNIWRSVSDAWQALLLLFGLALAFMARLVKEDVNDTKLLAQLTVAHLICCILRLAVNAAISDPVDLMAYRSYLLSADCWASLILFIIPKLLQQSDKRDNKEHLPDFYARTTLMHADIFGFSAWASSRDPVLVFKLLEEVFSEFERQAERRMVMKIETVGHTYVAATGIPQERRDHAIQMARYATDCMSAMAKITKELEIKFGPDTAELSLRVGLHSGYVILRYLPLNKPSLYPWC